MPSFGITPASGFPPPTDQGFPRFIQWQVNGDNIGSRSLVETVNLMGNISASVNSGGDTATVDLDAVGGALSWREVAGDYTLQAEDAGNGIATTGVSGAQTIVIPDDSVEIDIGRATLVLQDASGGVQFVAASGVELIYRSSVFAAEVAGQGGIVTLIKRAANRWVLCGDMALA